MAIKRNTDGSINMNEFENHLKASSRQEGYLEIIMFTPDPNVRLNSITSNDKLDICNIDSVGDIRKYTNITVATLEENLWLLNSRFPVYQNGKVDGYISNSMSNSNGEFITNPKMTVQLSSAAEAENFSVILNPAVPTGYPKTIKLYCYDKDNNYKIVSDDLYKNGIFDDNDNEIANNIAKKVTIPDENKQNKKRNNDTRF